MSKWMLFDFECDDGHLFEELVKPDTRTLECPVCAKQAKRLVSKGHLDVFGMGIYSSSFPTLADKWAKMQYQKAKTDKGSTVDGAPNLKMY